MTIPALGLHMHADVEPHLRTDAELQELFQCLEILADRLCQTQLFVLSALKAAGLTVVPLDPHAREVAPVGAAPDSNGLRDAIAAMADRYLQDKGEYGGRGIADELLSILDTQVSR